MRRPFFRVLMSVFPLTLASCTSVDGSLRNTVVLRYQHVANLHRINFSSPVLAGRRAAPVPYVTPLESDGFWAVFVLCGLDASGAGIPSFYFDIDRFRVRFGQQSFGPLRPYTLRLGDSFELNKRDDKHVIADAITAEIQSGPPNRVFRHGNYPNLDVRFAIYIPRGLPDYSGDRLPLSYEGGHTLVLGNDYPPSDIAVAGLGGAGVAGHCLPWAGGP